MPRNALLILEYAPSYPFIDEFAKGDIKGEFLPPNVMAV